MVKNSAQRIVFPILDADGDPVTGAGADTPDSEYSLDGAGFSDCTNEISELATNSGVYYLDLVAGETNGDVVAIQVKTATATTKTTVLVFYTSAQSLDTVDGVVDSILTESQSHPTLAEIEAGDLATIKTKTDGLNFTGANVDAQIKATDDIDLSATQKTSVNTEVDTALSDVDLDHLIQVTAGAEEPTDGSYLDQIMHKAAGQTFDATTDSLEALRDQGDTAWITAVGFSTHAAADIWAVGARALTDKAGFSLAADQSAVTVGTVNAIAASGIDGIWDEVVEGALTGRQVMRLNLAVLAGKSTGGGTATIAFRDNADLKDRISATVDVDGNRTAVVLDGA